MTARRGAIARAGLLISSLTLLMACNDDEGWSCNHWDHSCVCETTQLASQPTPVSDGAECGRTQVSSFAPFCCILTQTKDDTLSCDCSETNACEPSISAATGAYSRLVESCPPTARDCPPEDGPCSFEVDAVCEVGNKLYLPGQAFVADGCRSCSCNADGSTTCGASSCAETGCEFEGTHLMNGEAVSRGCSTCTCDVFDVVVCESSRCTTEKVCTMGDAHLAVGDVVLDTDGLGSCRCIEHPVDPSLGPRMVCNEGKWEGRQDITTCAGPRPADAIGLEVLYLAGDVLLVRSELCFSVPYQVCADADAVGTLGQPVPLWIAADRGQGFACDGYAEDLPMQLVSLVQLRRFYGAPSEPGPRTITLDYGTGTRDYVF